jgi:hypothetical protein
MPGAAVVQRQMSVKAELIEPMFAPLILDKGDDCGGSLSRPHRSSGFTFQPAAMLPNELHGSAAVSSTEQQLVQGEWEAFTS